MSPLLALGIVVANFCTSFISGLLGMAGGITLLSLMTFVMPLKEIIPLHGIIQFVSNSSRSYFLRKYIRLDYTLYFCLGAPFGTIAAVYLIKSLPYPKVFMALLAASILYALFRPKKLPPLKVSPPAFIVLGIVVGFFGPLIGATGPFIASFFLRDDFTKKEVVATKASVQMFGHLLKIPAFLHLNFPFEKYYLVLIAVFIAGVIGTKAGVMALGKVSEKHFQFLYRFALFIAVCRIITKLFE